MDLFNVDVEAPIGLLATAIMDVEKTISIALAASLSTVVIVDPPRLPYNRRIILSVFAVAGCKRFLHS
jgi:hypothetical protein